MVVSILWVDDDYPIFTGLKDFLEDGGFVMTVSSAMDDAVIKLMNGKYDILLFDLILAKNEMGFSLERKKGLELAKVAIKRDVRHLVVYSVVPENECRVEIKEIRNAIEKKGNGSTFNFYNKSESVRKIVDYISCLKTE